VHVDHELPESMPDVQFTATDGTVHLPALLARAFGVSTSEARRSLVQGAVRIDKAPVSDGRLDVPVPEVDGHVLQLGKRRFARVKILKPSASA